MGSPYDLNATAQLMRRRQAVAVQEPVVHKLCDQPVALRQHTIADIVVYELWCRRCQRVVTPIELSSSGPYELHVHRRG